ncbi:MAG: CoA-transferase family III domain-containing protein [Monoraphidium minutum]|nr:MAG: CoA-transferase family III domain-containing protein [Monoraphidium minutum]
MALFAQAQAQAPRAPPAAPACRVHVVNNTGAPRAGGGAAAGAAAASALRVRLGEARGGGAPLGRDVTDAAVMVTVRHPDVSALQLELTAAPDTPGAPTRTAVLKRPSGALGGGGGADMQQASGRRPLPLGLTWAARQAVFSDLAVELFPTDAPLAPLLGALWEGAAARAANGSAAAAAAAGAGSVWTLTAADADVGALGARMAALPAVAGFQGPAAGGDGGVGGGGGFTTQASLEGVFGGGRDPETRVPDFGSTLVRCYYDIYWCYREAGVGGTLSSVLVEAWDADSAPARAALEGAQAELFAAVARFQGGNPQLAAWGDVLFFSAIDALYDAAAANAALSVGRAYVDTTVRLALLLSPVSISVDPRAGIIQAYQLIIDVGRSILRALQELPFTVDGDPNNNAEALAAFFDDMIVLLRDGLLEIADDAGRQAEGAAVAARASMEEVFAAAEGVTASLAQQLESFAPGLAGLLSQRPAAGGGAAAVERLRAATLDADGVFARAQEEAQVLSADFERVITELSDVTRDVAADLAQAIEGVQVALDALVPGPSLEAAIAGARNATQAVMEEARRRLAALLPSDALDAAAASLAETIDAAVAGAAAAAARLNADGGPVDAAAAAIDGLAARVREAQAAAAALADGAQQALQGPLVSVALGTVRRQSERTAGRIDDAAARALAAAPGLDPASLVAEIETAVGQLISDLESEAAPFSAAAPPGAAAQLAGALPGAVNAANDALAAAAAATGALATGGGGAGGGTGGAAGAALAGLAGQLSEGASFEEGPTDAAAAAAGGPEASGAATAPLAALRGAAGAARRAALDALAAGRAGLAAAYKGAAVRLAEGAAGVESALGQLAGMAFGSNGSGGDGGGEGRAAAAADNARERLAAAVAQVLDLGQVVAGNFCGTLLGYFGADIIKVEPPKGDPLRSLRLLDASGESLWWRCHGRNKRCIAIDLHKEEGQELVRRLANRADVLIENFRPGVMEKWGLAPKDLKPELVYTRIRRGRGAGYGQTGPKAAEPGYASVCEAFGGFRSINGYADRPPVRPNISLGDTLAGMHGAFGAVMALLHRQRSGAAAADGASGGGGGGQVVDASISESIFNMLEAATAEAALGHERPASGSTISGVVPSGTFRTRDGRYAVIGGNGDSVYSRLMAAIGRPDMAASNDKYSSNPKRVDAEAEIMGEIAQWAAAHTQEEVLEAMRAARVPAGPILTPTDLLSEPQFVERGMFHSAAPPRPPRRRAAAGAGGGGAAGAGAAAEGDVGRGEVLMPAILPVLQGTPGATRWAGPALGCHTDDVLMGELGLGAEEVARLRALEVVA